MHEEQQEKISSKECSMPESSTTGVVETEPSPPPPDVKLVNVDVEETQDALLSDTASTSIAFLHPFVRSKSTQTTFAGLSSRSIKTQTLIDANSSFLFPIAETSETEAGKTHSFSAVSTSKGKDIVEVEVGEGSSASEQSSDKSDKQDYEFKPTEPTPDSEDSCDEESNSANQLILQQGKPPQEQMKLIVFEDAILEVFGVCRVCELECTVMIESQRGSSCTISSRCLSESNNHVTWVSGLTIHGMPVFHLLLATGVLATGMEASKVLRLFTALKIPNVKQREFSSIFKNHVIPTVYDVWQKEQII